MFDDAILTSNKNKNVSKNTPVKTNAGMFDDAILTSSPKPTQNIAPVVETTTPVVPAPVIEPKKETIGSRLTNLKNKISPFLNDDKVQKVASTALNIVAPLAGTAYNTSKTYIFKPKDEEQATITKKFNEYTKLKEQSTVDETGNIVLPKESGKEAFNRIFIEEKGAQAIPFLSSAVDIKDLTQIATSYKKLEDGTADEYDLMRLSNFVDENSRDKTRTAKVLDVVTGSLAFGGELLSTAGIGAGVKTTGVKATKEFLEKAMSDKGASYIKKKTAEMLLKKEVAPKIVGNIAKEAIRAPIAGATRIGSSTINKMLPQVDWNTVEKNEVGQYQAKILEEGDGVGLALTKAFGSQYVEVLSERAGDMFGLIGSGNMISDLASKTAIGNAFIKANRKLGSNKAVQAFNSIVKKAGWNGIINEMLEERVGSVGYEVLQRLGLSDEGFTLPTKEDLITELISFSIPGTIIGLTQTALGKFGNASDVSDAMDSLNTDVQDNIQKSGTQVTKDILIKELGVTEDQANVIVKNNAEALDDNRQIDAGTLDTAIEEALLEAKNATTEAETVVDDVAIEKLLNDTLEGKIADITNTTESITEPLSNDITAKLSEIEQLIKDNLDNRVPVTEIAKELRKKYTEMSLKQASDLIYNIKNTENKVSASTLDTKNIQPEVKEKPAKKEPNLDSLVSDYVENYPEIESSTIWQALDQKSDDSKEIKELQDKLKKEIDSGNRIESIVDKISITRDVLFSKNEEVTKQRDIVDGKVIYDRYEYNKDGKVVVKEKYKQKEQKIKKIVENKPIISENRQKLEEEVKLEQSKPEPTKVSQETTKISENNTPNAVMPLGTETHIRVGENGDTTIKGNEITSENTKVSYKVLNDIGLGKQPVSTIEKHLKGKGVPQSDIDSILSRTPRVDGQTFTDNVFDAITEHNNLIKEQKIEQIVENKPIISENRQKLEEKAKKQESELNKKDLKSEYFPMGKAGFDTNVEKQAKNIDKTIEQSKEYLKTTQKLKETTDAEKAYNKIVKEYFASLELIKTGTKSNGDKFTAEEIKELKKMATRYDVKLRRLEKQFNIVRPEVQKETPKKEEKVTKTELEFEPAELNKNFDENPVAFKTGDIVIDSDGNAKEITSGNDEFVNNPEAPMRDANISYVRVKDFGDNTGANFIGYANQLRKATPEELKKLGVKEKKEEINKAPDNEIPLFELAKNYSTPEAFVRSQGDSFFHTTPAQFDKFDKAFLGENTQFDNATQGFFFTDNIDQIQEFKDVLQKGFGGGFTIDNRTKTAEEISKYRVIEKIAKKEDFFNFNYDAKDITAKEAREFAEFADKKMGGLYTMDGDKANHKKMNDKQLIEFLNDEIFVEDLDPDSSFTPRFTEEYLGDFVKFLEKKGYKGMISNYGNGKNEYLIFDPNSLPTRDELESIWNEANGKIKTPEIKESNIETQDQSTVSNLADYSEFRKNAVEGKITVEQFKQGFADFIKNEEQIKADLMKLNKPELLKRSVYSRTSDKKEDVAKQVLSDMKMWFALGKAVSYSFGAGNMDTSLNAVVENITQEDLVKYAEDVKKLRAERAEKIAEFKKSIQNPETLEDFRTFIEVNGKEAFTDEQRIKYDELIALKQKDKEAQTLKEKGVVAGVQTSTTMTLEETTNTKTGEPLFKVKMADRIAKDQYIALNNSAKKLGGYYSTFAKGFLFKDKTNAENFIDVSSGKTVETGIAQEKFEEKKQNTGDKLIEMSIKLEEVANNKLSQDRKTNTARRANMANGIEADARKDIAIAKTMRNLGLAIKAGDAKLLDKLTTKTQIVELDTILARANYTQTRQNSKETGTFETQVPIDEKTVDLVDEFYPNLWIKGVQETAEKASTKKGLIQASKNVLKFVANVKAKGMDNGTPNSLIMDDIITITEGMGDEAHWALKDAVTRFKRLEAMGIKSIEQLRATLREYVQFKENAGDADKVKQLERDIVGKKVGVDFFPTPKNVAEQMVDMANIEEGMKVLEPSAGNGNIADVIRETGVSPDVAEISSELRKILEAKGYNVIANDFMDINEKYDRVIMNPPFSNGMDIDHVKKAYDLLNDGGKVIAIVGEGAFIRSDKKATEFRNWLDEVGASVEELPAGTFKDTNLLATTGANARLIEIYKPEYKTSSVVFKLKPKIGIFNRTIKITPEEAKQAIEESLARNKISIDDVTILFPEFEKGQGILGSFRENHVLYGDLINLYQRKGKIGLSTALHESKHFLISRMPDNLRNEIFDQAKIDITPSEKKSIEKEYKGKSLNYMGNNLENGILEEYIVNKWTKSDLKEFYGQGKTIWEKTFEFLDNFLEKIINVYTKISEWYESIPNKQGGFIKNPIFNTGDKKQDALLALEAVEKRVGVTRIPPVRRVNVSGAKIQLSPELEQEAQALELEEEYLDENPLNYFWKYANKKEGTLPEVGAGTEGGVFARFGDDLVNRDEFRRFANSDGTIDTEKIRDEFYKLFERKKDFKERKAQHAKDVKAYIAEQKDELALTKIAQDAEKKQLADIKAREQEVLKDEKQALADKAMEDQKIEEAKKQERIRVINKAFITPTQELNAWQRIISRPLNPLKYVDTLTKNIFKEWNASILKGRLRGSKMAREFSDIPQTEGLDTIMKYEAGENTKYSSKIKKVFDDLLDEARSLNMDMGFRENYLPHIYKENAEKIQLAIRKYLKDKGLTDEMIISYENGDKLSTSVTESLKLSPFYIKERVFPTYRVAMKYGLTPKYTHVAQLVGHYVSELETVKSNNKLLEDLEKTGKILEKDKAPNTWKILDIPFSQSNFKAPTSTAELFNGLFRQYEKDFFHYTANIAKGTQGFMLSGGTPFSPFNLFTYGQTIRELTRGNIGILKKLFKSVSNTSSAKWLEENSKYLEMMAEENIDLGTTLFSYEQMYSDLKDFEGFWGKSGELFDRAFNKKTFMAFMPMMHTQLFKDTYNTFIEKGYDHDFARNQAGETTKSIFGLSGFTGRSKRIKDILSTLLFAPVFRESIIRMLYKTGYAGYDFAKNVGGLRSPLDTSLKQNRQLLAGMVITFALYNVLNAILNDDDDDENGYEFMWDNPKHRKFALRIPLSDGTVVYIEFMPSTFAFVRNLASGVIDTGKGDFKGATQKFGSVFSTFISLPSDAIGNEDYFGNQIYKDSDTGAQKAFKIAKYLGLKISHPYIREAVDQIEKKQPVYQSIVEGNEFPVKFSSLDKEAKSEYYDAIDKKAKENAQMRTKVKPVYDKVQKLKEEGKIDEANTLYETLNEDEKIMYSYIKQSPYEKAVERNDMFDEAIKSNKSKGQIYKELAEEIYGKNPTKSEKSTVIKDFEFYKEYNEYKYKAEAKEMKGLSNDNKVLYMKSLQKRLTPAEYQEFIKKGRRKVTLSSGSTSPILISDEVLKKIR